MKAEEYLSWTVPQTFIAKVLGLTQGRISQLLAEGIFVRDEESGQMRFHDSLRNYYLSKNATGAGVNFWTEKALHEKANRELAELTLAKRRGELCETAAVEQELGEILTDCRNKLLGLGHKLAPRLEGKTTAQISDTIRDEIIGILKELSGDVEKADYRAGET